METEMDSPEGIDSFYRSTKGKMLTRPMALQ